MVPAIILARGGSKRIPKKNIIDFCGKPLVAWSIEHARGSRSVDKVFVSTDDGAIADVAKKYGAEVIERPADMASDTSTSEDALKHAIGEISKTEEIEYVVFLQPTSPLRESSDIDTAVKTARKEGADSLFSAARLGDFYLWKKLDGGLSSLNYDYKNRKRSQEFGEQFVENGSIYVFKPEVLLTYNNRMGGKISLSLMELWKSFEVDSPEDIEFCADLFRLKKLDK